MGQRPGDGEGVEAQGPPRTAMGVSTDPTPSTVHPTSGAAPTGMC